MGYLDDLLNNKLKKTSKKTTKNNAESLKMIYLIKTNTYNNSDPAHRLYKAIAIRQGYVDNDLNILKEE